MTYDFDALTDRSGTYSLKWEEAGDALPMWVADMDFQTAPPDPGGDAPQARPWRLRLLDRAR